MIPDLHQSKLYIIFYILFLTKKDSHIFNLFCLFWKLSTLSIVAKIKIFKWNLNPCARLDLMNSASNQSHLVLKEQMHKKYSTKSWHLQHSQMATLLKAWLFTGYLSIYSGISISLSPIFSNLPITWAKSHFLLLSRTL